MRMTHMEQEQEVQAFARRAAAHFAKEPGHYTYTDGDIQAGELFAMRYGLGDDCVVVFRIDTDFTPTNYQELIREYQADSVVSAMDRTHDRITTDPSRI